MELDERRERLVEPEADEHPARERQYQGETLDLHLVAVEPDAVGGPVDLALGAGRVFEPGRGPLPRRRPDLADVLLEDGVAALVSEGSHLLEGEHRREPVLEHQSLDHGLERVELARASRATLEGPDGPIEPAQDAADHVDADAQLPGGLSDAAQAGVRVEDQLAPLGALVVRHASASFPVWRWVAPADSAESHWAISSSAERQS